MSDDAMICISMNGNGRHYVWVPGRGVGSLICFSKLSILELQILISHHEKKNSVHNFFLSTEGYGTLIISIHCFGC